MKRLLAAAALMVLLLGLLAVPLAAKLGLAAAGAVLLRLRALLCGRTLSPATRQRRSLALRLRQLPLSTPLCAPFRLRPHLFPTPGRLRRRRRPLRASGS